AAALLGDQPAEALERHHPRSAEAAQAARARQVALGHERRLLRKQPIHRRPEWLSAARLDDRAEAACGLAAARPTDDERDRHADTSASRAAPTPNGCQTIPE